ncbi:DUF6339 family protein [Pseudomonas sp. TWP3-2]|uniref:DUF6339 family protein n=1 Tax=Pseudomonas sp. TWP3-2 TaxID=2804574 RepID=UPI003CF01122
MMRVSLLPRLKAHGVATLLEKLKIEPRPSRIEIDSLSEYSALKSSAASGGTKADAVAVNITAELRKIAQDAGFPTSNSQAARAQFDKNASIYLGQLEPLQSGEALRDDVWAFMTTVLGPDIVMWRFNDKQQERVARFAGGVRNSFQRLWVRGTTLDRGQEHALRWELITQLTEDAMVQIFERASIGGNSSLARAVAEGWLEMATKVGRAPMEGIMRSATKILRVKNQVIDLGYLSTEELRREVANVFDIAAHMLSNVGKSEAII